MKLYRLLLPLILLLSACAAPVAQAPTPLPPTASPAPTEPTAEPTAAPTQTPMPTLEPTPAPPLYLGAPEGRDAAGAYTLGDPAAPLVLTDYSDFL